MATSKKTKVLVLNGIIAAMYVALSLVSPFSQGIIQFRISESLNHLVVFNKKLMWGVVGGVVLYNLLFSELVWLDVLFGGGQTFLALGLTALLTRYVPNVKIRLAMNTLFFTISMVLIAWMIVITTEVPIPFWATYGSLALSELIIMTLSAPIMYYVNKKIDFSK
ncbi:QueT transporter family protein [Vagococcus intermedius]|uniref:QueT transporter family protein n=1 Tax=Vagococcus intermedius TaxID=2991418 RepID=A0AAF0I9S8_9ENTE|nr:QueT transporter family protein [Vagococcus intermedius]WEG73712.1 QueT transporter family protein [Vagococcus intermedius]WEG75797.1 QueT transporter family protein [Vagococcus intermedius]